LPIDVAACIAECEDDGSGALTMFAGTVRTTSPRRPDAPVEAITYTAYEPLAEKVLRELELEVVEKTGARSCLIRHRIGLLLVGEVSVIIVVRAAHRDAAFAAVRLGIDELKQRAPIWKKEHFVGEPAADGPKEGDEPSRT
jgi:molybdopterin synthase catalytic subunit